MYAVCSACVCTLVHVWCTVHVWGVCTCACTWHGHTCMWYMHQHMCTCVWVHMCYRPQGMEGGSKDCRGPHTHPFGCLSFSTGTRGPLPMGHTTCCHRRISVTDICPLSHGFVPRCSWKCQTLSFCGRGLYCSQTLTVWAGPSPDSAWLRKSSLHYKGCVGISEGTGPSETPLARGKPRVTDSPAALVLPEDGCCPSVCDALRPVGRG